MAMTAAAPLPEAVPEEELEEPDEVLLLDLDEVVVVNPDEVEPDEDEEAETAEELPTAAEEPDSGTTGVERPAGTEAAAGSEVTAAVCEVTTEGWPVTTPSEFVSVKYWVAGF